MNLEEAKLISLFMGRCGKEYKNLYTFKGVSDLLCCDIWFTLEDSKFHNDWNWLIKVLKKIRSIVNEKFTIHDFESFREMNLKLNPYDYDINQIYKDVIIFIEWYNKLN